MTCPTALPHLSSRPPRIVSYAASGVMLISALVLLAWSLHAVVPSLVLRQA